MRSTNTQPMRSLNCVVPDHLREEIYQAAETLGAPSIGATVRALIVLGLSQINNKPSARPNKRNAK